ncbi:MAG: aldo/keto reductase [Dehalococcoidales bacterium]|nr:aldo/keto reductase [Dehalococcoidales bacterium]
MESPPQDEVNRIIKTALDGGINWFDAAELYGRGESERALATDLCKADYNNKDVVIATKWMPFFRTSGNIARTIDERISCLSPCNIDLYQIHMPNSLSSIEAQMDAMAALVKQGKIRCVGVSNFSTRQMRRAHTALARHGLPLASNQIRYNLLHREPDNNGVLEAAKELNVSIIAYSPVAQGLLSGKFHDNPELIKKLPFIRRSRVSRQIEGSRKLINNMKRIAAAHNCSLTKVALSWLVNYHGELVVAIPGATQVDHVRQNVGALTLKLTPQEMTELDNELKLEKGHYEIDFKDLEGKFCGDKQPKMMILCHPHNPVGRVWTEKELRRMGEIVVKNDALMVSDEIHCELLFRGYKHFPFAALSEEFAQNSLVCMAPSKTFNLAGLSASTIIIPNKKIRDCFCTARMGFTTGTNAYGLVGLEAAYRYGDEWLEQLLEYLQGNLKFLIEFVESRIPEITVIRPEGTYLVWLDFRKLDLTPNKLREFLIEKAKVGLEDGTIFGPEGVGFQRMNIACPRATLKEALERIEGAVRQQLTADS